MGRLSAFPLLMWVVWGCTPSHPARTRRTHNTVVALGGTPSAGSSRILHDAAGLSFIEAITGGANAEDTLPLIVVLHGSSARPEGIIGFFADLPVRARVVALRGPLPDGSGFSWFSLDSDLASGIRNGADAVAPALAELARQRPTCGLPIVSGFSQGAMVVYALALHSPPIVRAAVTIAGMLPETWGPVMRPDGGTLPEVQGFHGEADLRVPVGDGWRTITMLRELGFVANLTTEPDAGHTTTPTMRASVYSFLSRVARCDQGVGDRSMRRPFDQ